MIAKIIAEKTRHQILKHQLGILSELVKIDDLFFNGKISKEDFMLYNKILVHYSTMLSIESERNLKDGSL